MDKGTLIRTILLLVSYLNAFLVANGKQPLPVIDEMMVALFLTFVTSVWAWWKNNYVSKKGLAQKEVLERRGLK